MVTKPIKVRRSAWRHLSQTALTSYTENVISKTAEAPYDPIRSLLTTLSDLNKEYNDCLAQALSRSHPAVVRKNEVKSQLFSALEDVATGLEANAKGDELFVVDAGMQLHKSRTNHTGELLPPTELSAESTSVPGQAKLRFKYPRNQRTQVETFAVEWRKDAQSAWTNGTYRNSQRIVVDDLPERSEITFRVRSLGTRGRKSTWSEVATAFVV